MPTLRDGDLRLWTFREGLLSAVGHDLVLRAARWTVTLDGDAVDARVAADAVTPLGAREAGALRPGALSRRDLASIEISLQNDILKSKAHPEIRWTGRALPTSGGLTLPGTLQLRGVVRPLTLQGSPQGTDLVVTGVITPSDWGIPPFRALMGTLRVADRVEVHARIRGWPQP